MAFSSFHFVFFFLPVALLLYYAAPRTKGKNAVLLALSLFFYAFGEPVCAVLLVCLALLNYILVGRMAAAKTLRARRFFLIAAVGADIIFLCYFKYAGFFLANLGLIFGAEPAAAHILLPAGISFFTFKTITYAADVYAGSAEPARNFFSLLLYISFFPEVMSGPITRYADAAGQLSGREHGAALFASGATRFLTGLAKKLLIADRLAAGAGRLLPAAQDASVLGGWLGLLLFSFQIYFDFSAYSDMAIGLGRMLGFQIRENFDYPYISSSITEFWRRWHISLSSFFRDYVYIPLGGNRKRAVRNILAVWLLTGLWHGASWNFILWGLYFCLLLLLEKYLFAKILKKIPAFFKHFFTLFAVMLGWGLFYFRDFPELSGFFRRIFGLSGAALFSENAVAVLTGSSLLLVLCVAASLPLARFFKLLYEKFVRAGGALMHIGLASQLAYNSAALLLCTAAMAANSYSAFLYFKF